MTEEIKENKNKKGKKFSLEEYVIKHIQQILIAAIIKQYLIDINIEQIVNYNYDKFFNQLRDILKKNKFREREIKKAEIYLFDIFFNNINTDKF